MKAAPNTLPTKRLNDGRRRSSEHTGAAGPLGIICTLLGGVLKLWIIARLSSIFGQQQTWAPPLTHYESVTLAVALVGTGLLAFGLVRLATPREASMP